MYALSGQVRTGGQVLGNSNKGGEPLREDGDGISSSIMVIHPPQFQGGQDVGSIDGGVVPEHLVTSEYLIHRPQVILDLLGASGYVAMTIRQYFLLFGLSFL